MLFILSLIGLIVSLTVSRFVGGMIILAAMVGSTIVSFVAGDILWGIVFAVLAGLVYHSLKYPRGQDDGSN